MASRCAKSARLMLAGGRLQRRWRMVEECRASGTLSQQLAALSDVDYDLAEHLARLKIFVGGAQFMERECAV